MIEHSGDICKAFTSKWDGYSRSTCSWKKVFWTKKCIQVGTEHLDLLDEYSRWSNRKKEKSSQKSFHARDRETSARWKREKSINYKIWSLRFLLEKKNDPQRASFKFPRGFSLKMFGAWILDCFLTDTKLFLTRKWAPFFKPTKKC